MKNYLVLLLFITAILKSCAQSSELENVYEGRIYILESQKNFFQLKGNGVAKYYSIEEMGERTFTSSDAVWSISKDTTLTLTVKYEPKYENAEFILKYNEEKDYWIDEDFISAFRRIKQVKYKEFELNEF